MLVYNLFSFLCVLIRVLKFLVILIIKKYLCVLLKRTVVNSTVPRFVFTVLVFYFKQTDDY